MMAWIVLGVVCAGAGMAVQLPMVSVLTQRLGSLQAMVIVNITGFATAALILLFTSRPLFGPIHSLPWYVYLAGPLGIGVMTMIAWAISRIGISSALVLSIAAQLIVGLVLDRAGYLGLPVRVIELPRVVGMGLIVLGAWFVAR